ncbi:MAG: AraC family transcriptional regulator [Eubacterium sp.]|nr:AraC family transcriptional regulator [Eubacterium sp.]
MENKHSFRAEYTENASLSVYNVGYEKCAPLHRWGSGVRDHYLIHHIVSGKGIYSVGGKSYTLSAGDTFLIYPNTEITYTADGVDPWSYYWIGFNGSDAEQLLARTDFSRDYPVISTDFGDELRRSIQTAYDMSGRHTSDSMKMTGQLYITLGILMSRSTHKTSARHSRAESCVRKAVRFMDFNYAMNISIRDVADYAGVSRTTLYRAFIVTEGISPVEFLTALRLSQAKKLLQNTDLPISAVARSVGFEDALYFSRVFRKEENMTPGEYRHGINNK